MALPTLSRTIDDDFVNTWYEIRSEVINQVLDATILWAALNNFGCLTPQVGGEYITRSVRYGKASTQRISKGKVLTQNVVKLDTMARWDWRYFLVDVNRSLIDDLKNSGPYRIKDYLMARMEAAKDGLVADLETYISQWGAYYAGDAQPNGLYDIVCNYVAKDAVGAGSASNSQAVGTSNGNINRATNAWWRNWVMYNDATETPDSFIAGPTVEPYASNLLPDLRHMYNSITANQDPPNLILCDQDIYEAYEDEVSDKLQIVRNSFTKLAGDLGFEALTYRGATMSYSAKLAGTNHVFLLNMNHIELVYDPEAWFEPVPWKDTPNQLESVMYIICMTPGLITDEPRRHGVMEYYS